ncbi:MAG: M48 family metallopeptidase [Eubacterium sp.]|nr:M48 family metallopeptidase [Eubacterium sp.]
MEVTIIRSKRKTIAIQIKPDMSVTVRAPYYATSKDIEKILQEKEAWINKHLEQFRVRKEQTAFHDMIPLTQEEIRHLAKTACDYIPTRVRFFAEKMGVNYGRITIRKQKTRWGSCSSKGNLNFNCLLMLTPPEIIDYVVVHELCHRKEMNHSKAFWREVEKILPDYKQAVKWLKTEGAVIMQRGLLN